MRVGFDGLVNFEQLLEFIDCKVFSQTQRHLRDVEVLILKGAWEGLNYEEIASTQNYTTQYLGRDVGPKLWRLLSAVLNESVSKRNFQTAVERHWRSSLAVVSEAAIALSEQKTPLPAHLFNSPQDKGLPLSLPILRDLQEIRDLDEPPVQGGIEDWGEAVDVSAFYGRAQELQQLSQWLIQDHCRLICVLGMGGIGKTSLAIKLGQQVTGEFDYLIWRSLRHGPPLDELIADLVHFLSDQAEIDLPQTLEGSVARLLHYLRRSRCLIILDNLESLLQGGIQAGNYSPEYEGYGYLLQSIGEIAHGSCVVVTSREKTREISLLEGPNLPVRSHPLSGLTPQEGQVIFTSKGCTNIDETALGIIFEHYAGNPLALKMVASSVLELSDGNLSDILPYLSKGLLQFQHIDALLESQFERLSDVEQQILYWLAIHRDPLSFQELAIDLVPEAIPQILLDAIQSLGRRCLIERMAQKLYLQPVVMEFITNRLIKQVSDELYTQNFNLLHRFPFLKAESQDYIQQAQAQFLLRPIIETLNPKLAHHISIEAHLKSALAQLQQTEPQQPSYAAGNLLNLLCEIDADLSQIDCSNLAIWQANLVGINLHHANFAGADVSKTRFASTLSAAISVAFSPDGQQFAIGSADNTIRLYRTQDFQEVMTLEGHLSWVCSVVFSPDSQTLASGSIDRTIKLWNLQKGSCEKTLQGHTGWVWSVSFSPDGNTLASSQTLASDHPDQSIRLWDALTGECLHILEGHRGWVWTVAFSPDGQTLASGGDDHSIRIWDSQTGAPIAVWESHTHWVRSVAFSPDGQTLASGSHDGTVRIWAVQTGQCQQVLKGHRYLISSVTFLPSATHPETVDEVWIASGSHDGTVRIWNLKTGQCLKSLQGHTSGLWNIAVHPQGSILASAANDCTVRLWNLQTGQALKTLQGYGAGLKTVIVLGENSQTLVTGGDDKTVKFWDLHTGKCTKVLTGHQSWVWDVALSGDGTMLASSSGDCSIRLWDVETGQLRRILQGHLNIILSVDFSPDGQKVVSGSHDQTIRFWHAKTGACLHTIPVTGRTWSVVFSPDGKTVVSGHDHPTVRLWDVTSGDCIREFHGHTNIVFAVAFSPDGQFIASGSEDGLVKIWSVASGECLHTFQEHTVTVWSVQFHPNGKQVVSSGFDHTIRLWDLETGTCPLVLNAHDGEVWRVVFGPMLNQMTSVGQDGLLKIWDLDTQQSVNSLRDDRPYEQMNIANVTGLTPAQRDALIALGAVEMT